MIVIFPLHSLNKIEYKKKRIVHTDNPLLFCCIDLSFLSIIIESERSRRLIFTFFTHADNHQYKNAKVLSDAGAAVLIEEKELTAEYICGKVDGLYSDRGSREEMQKNISVFAADDVEKRIYEEMTKLIAAKGKMKK